jgi:lipoic acid synthetase
MLRLEARNSQVPIERKPPWIKTRLRTGPAYTELKALVRSEGLHTVCEEAGCPNIFECWEDREATFLIGGDQCTRRCDFCQIDTGKPQPLDEGEPRRVAESVAAMGLRYATVTGVARDDLADGGAWLYAQVCREIHAAIPGCGVELLIPDFNAEPDRLAEVFSARPEVLAHNIETVPRIFRRIRPGFRYARSLDVLRAARDAGLVTKSNLILGLGEERHEVTEAMKDLRTAGCDLLTITQYLRPTPRHHPVERWVKPEEFVELREEATELGSAGAVLLPGRAAVRPGHRAASRFRPGTVAAGTDGRRLERRVHPAHRAALATLSVYPDQQRADEDEEAEEEGPADGGNRETGRRDQGASQQRYRLPADPRRAGEPKGTEDHEQRTGAEPPADPPDPRGPGPSRARYAPGPADRDRGRTPHDKVPPTRPQSHDSFPVRQTAPPGYPGVSPTINAREIMATGEPDLCVNGPVRGNAEVTEARRFLSGAA